MQQRRKTCWPLSIVSPSWENDHVSRRAGGAFRTGLPRRPRPAQASAAEMPARPPPDNGHAPGAPAVTPLPLANAMAATVAFCRGERLTLPAEDASGVEADALEQAAVYPGHRGGTGAAALSRSGSSSRPRSYQASARPVSKQIRAKRLSGVPAQHRAHPEAVQVLGREVNTSHHVAVFEQVSQDIRELEGDAERVGQRLRSARSLLP